MAADTAAAVAAAAAIASASAVCGMDASLAPCTSSSSAFER